MNFKKIIVFVGICFNFSINTYAGSDKLIFAIDIIRHGDRNPAVEIPTAPYVWKEGLGELTPSGMRQEYQLGSKLRKKYIDQYHLLPVKYQSSVMYVRSSAFNRTLMSAQSLLLGLYPLGTGPKLAIKNQSALPNAYQPIPIHTIPQKQETLLIPDEDEYKFNALMARYVEDSQEWKQKSQAAQPLFKVASQLMQKPINTLRGLDGLADNLYIRQLHHVAMPKDVSADEIQAILELAQYSFLTRYKPYAVGQSTAPLLLQTIGDYFKQAVTGQSPLKFVLFSGHDSTIMSVMSALHVPLDQVPHYASDLNVALFQTRQQQYYVKVTYNDRIVKLPACPHEYCPLALFLKIAGV
jgi:lysosomal acid phosphatase